MGKKRKQQHEKYITWDNSKRKYILRVPGFDTEYYKDMNEAIRVRNIYVVAKESLEKESEIASSITLGEWINRWLSEFINTTEPRTIETYRYDLKRAFASLYDKPAVSIKGRELSECLKQLAEDGYAKSSVSRAARYIRQAYRELYRKGGVDIAILPTERMIMPRPADYTHIPETKNAYEFADLQKLEEAAKQEMVKETRENFAAALGILSVTGFRISEILAICKEDITFAPDKKSLSIDINKTAHDCTAKNNTTNPGKSWYIADHTKSQNSKRTIPIYFPSTIAAITVLLEREHPTAIQNGKEFNFLFATKNGAPITHSNFETAFRRIRKRAGYKTKIHEIRHSVATLMANNRNNDTQSSRFLGHQKDVFQNVYVHTTDSSNAEVARWLADQKEIAANTAAATTLPITAIKESTDANANAS